ncbi:MAG TPA: beta-N-acetylhexosaminidase [Rhodanobacteraceae bacterium]|nr:beta-N-acetylhexosaminidase [Rhodanobacteraceae bacterium]
MLIIGLAGTELGADERRWIMAEAVSGVILFTRNVASRRQLEDLVGEIRTLRGDRFLVCIDQEGGRVQRIRGAEFTDLPPLARLGALHRRDPAAAIAQCEQHAWLMASEMRALGIDLSFAPVVDLARGNLAIGDRAFDADPAVVGELAQAYVRGMHLAGMAATAKHFPGHGSVREDTHVDLAVDPRPLDALREADLLPFAACFAAGAEAVMLAHVRYPAVDAQPAGYSRVWIEDILRGDYGFEGVVFSDDVAMAAAAPAGALGERIHAHLDAGCDLVLVCKAEWGGAAIEAVSGRAPCTEERLEALYGAAAARWEDYVANPQRAAFVAQLRQLDAQESPA